jgi:VanZ family protein
MRPAMSRLLTLFLAPARRPLWRALLLALLATITWLALSPKPPPTADTGWDKANHALAFAALAFSAVWALWPRPRQWLLWLAPALLAYGGFIEIAQSFTPQRQGDWADLLADAVGIALGLLAAWAVGGLARRQTTDILGMPSSH